ncbi:MAG: ribonuclease, partial [Psychrobacter urativorans]
STTRQVTQQQVAVIKDSADAEKERQESTTEQHADKQKPVDSKPAQQTAQNVDTSNDVADKTQQDSAQSEAAEKSLAPVHQVEKSATNENAQQSTSKVNDEGSKKDCDKNSNQEPSVEEQVTTTSSIDSDAEVTAPSQEVVVAQAEEKTATASQQTDVAITTSEDLTVSTEEKATDTIIDADINNSIQTALEVSPKDLFAKRYVTANKFGQASNDPRVVRQQQAQPSVDEESQATAQVLVSAPAIRGTVGEFIRATLVEAENRLATEGVISCFNAAIAMHLQQAQAKGSADKQVTIKPIAHSEFDFSNYGYQPLAADYIARFESMTQAVSQFAAAQGKTSVEPRAINKRASNDPRGQHPDYEESALLATVSDEANDTAAQTLSDSDMPNVEADALANQAQTDAVSDHSQQLLEAEQTPAAVSTATVDTESTVKSDDTAEVQVTTADAEIKDVTDEQNDTAQSDESLVELSTKEDSQAAKSKTTIASYKNMIENVAEQLLPQKGMFNLTTPKVPKSRARKPKAEHKKPTQAEKSELDNSDSES